MDKLESFVDLYRCCHVIATIEALTAW